jgi:hypothetical protein
METKEYPQSWQLNTFAETLNARNLGEGQPVLNPEQLMEQLSAWPYQHIKLPVFVTQGHMYHFKEFVQRHQLGYLDLTEPNELYCTLLLDIARNQLALLRDLEPLYYCFQMPDVFVSTEAT